MFEKGEKEHSGKSSESKAIQFVSHEDISRFFSKNFVV